MASRNSAPEDSSPEPIVMLDTDMKPVKVKVDISSRAIADQPRRRYWVGLREECTWFSYIGVGGVQFCHVVEPARLSKDGTTTTRNQYLGNVESLTDGEIKTITDKLKMKVIRGQGPKRNIVNLDNAHQSPQPGDIPLARFLYMVELSDGFIPNRDINCERPEAMEQE